LWEEVSFALKLEEVAENYVRQQIAECVRKAFFAGRGVRQNVQIKSYKVSRVVTKQNVRAQ
jgi:hypothetical protein